MMKKEYYVPHTVQVGNKEEACETGIINQSSIKLDRQMTLGRNNRYTVGKIFKKVLIVSKRRILFHGEMELACNARMMNYTNRRYVE